MEPVWTSSGTPYVHRLPVQSDGVGTCHQKLTTKDVTSAKH